MKARVKATSEIVSLQGTIDSFRWITDDYRVYNEYELDFTTPDSTPLSNPSISLADLRKILHQAVDAGYINEYGAHRIIDLIKK